MTRNALFLLLIWLGQGTLVLLMAYFNPNHFTTIDSGYYLESAMHLLRGEGHTYLVNGRLVWNGIFPVGYPAAIALVSLLSGLSPLWASKVVNLLASTVFLYLLRHWFGERKALVTGILLLLGQFVKLWAHTWSEPLFLVLLFSWAYLFFNSPKSYILIFLVGTLLMLVRYAGIFIIPLAGILAVVDFWEMQRVQAQSRLLLALGWALVMGGYFYYNFSQSGDWYGGARFEENLPFLQSMVQFAQGTLNEFFLFRDTDFTHFDLLFAAGLVLQVALTLLFFAGYKAPVLTPFSSVRFAWLTAFAYLIFLFTIRLFSPFDAPGYRLLSPFSFLFFWGILYRVPDNTFSCKRAFIGGVAVIASWLHLLPQTNLESKLKPLWLWFGMT
ncbi:hypothetical protein [Salmonirosea aquatica]|uniref:Glycosyltransferase RgtA/B/C/D-like domain-containing protein n=1 Tax=Salmonirosea aquatica TaxID=2654236 RepID=A0A7C9FRE6_9BACT|nr:hypothetical protein [Cytophagaceae bacterium SJW1-29]